MELFLKKEITDYFIRSYNCHSIILYGSYVDGNFTDESDIDVICFTDQLIGNSNDTSFLGGKQLDAWIYETKKMKHINEFLRVKSGEILFDKRGICTQFLTNINELFQQGPKQLALEEKQHFQNWAHKMYRRAEQGDIEGHFRYHWLLVNILEIYFKIKGIWYLGPKQSLKWLYENDKEAYILFNCALNPHGSIEDVKNLTEHIIRL